ncbi:flagellin [Sporosarcina sp. NCCP-2716]|uniref:flagellin n=1 Tax=Sporosarcina sp. NCCP-2716 TaxID=2943679 RepID=UPI00203F0868|nr:flagellin [Sporosarcina sp. NCCP-2716]GKV69391.1 flagellin [Sporosarcina sp. NCCP-2716]
MRINSQELIQSAANQGVRNDKQIEKSLRHLGTGLKVAVAADDAAGKAISETMRAQIRGISQAQRNMQDGLSVLESANEGMNNVNGLLQRARELAVSTANGTFTDADRAASGQELTQILAAVDDTAGKLEFNTKKILGEDMELTLHVGANPTQQLKVSLFDVSSKALGLEGATLGTQSDAEQLISKLDSAIQKVSGHLTKVGSQMEALQHHLSNAGVFEVNLNKSLSLLEDADMAQEMMNFVSQDIRKKGDELLIKHVNSTLQESLGMMK